MNIGTFRAASKAEVPESPDWLDKILKPIYAYLSQLSILAQGNISLEDNLLCEVRQLVVNHKVPAQVSLKTMKAKPLGVMRLFEDVNDDAWMQARIIDEKTVEVTFRFDSQDTATATVHPPVTVRVVVFGGRGK